MLTLIFLEFQAIADKAEKVKYLESLAKEPSIQHYRINFKNLIKAWNAK